MWPFRPRQLESASRLLNDADNERLSRLESRLDEVTHDFDRLQLEWLNVMDKIKSWAGRQAKRQQREAERALDADAASQEPAGDTIPAQVDSRSLSKMELRRLAASRFSRPNGGTR